MSHSGGHLDFTRLQAHRDVQTKCKPCHDGDHLGCTGCDCQTSRVHRCFVEQYGAPPRAPAAHQLKLPSVQGTPRPPGPSTRPRPDFSSKGSVR